jgi:hypothetical protein
MENQFTKALIVLKGHDSKGKATELRLDFKQIDPPFENAIIQLCADLIKRQEAKPEPVILHDKSHDS